MADGSIFGQIMGDITPFADALAGAASVAGVKSNAQNESDAAQLRSLRMEQALNNNKLNQPYSPQAFRAGQSQSTSSVNSDTVNQQWLSRLNRYSSMPDYQGGKAKGA